MSRYTFQVNKQYKRSEIKAVIGLDPNAKGGPWDTGYAERNGADFVFCNVGAAGRTGHDYDNHFDGTDLIWRGKTNSHIRQPTIQRMTSPGAEVHVFWRAEERDPFTYAGLAKAIEIGDETPVRVRWSLNSSKGELNQSRSPDRLPAEQFSKIEADHIFQAVQMLLDGQVEHTFGPSTDYDLIVMDRKRLPPKAVFGLAAKLALGFEVLPKHFTAGEASVCFRILRQAGYQIVAKDEQIPTPSPITETDQEWTEGKPKLIAHLVRERAKGLAQAKRSNFKREHGKLFCERCKLDPVATYGTADGEACIEVHHSDVHISEMRDGHKTNLASLQCLCANCHRLIHKILKRIA